MTHQELMKLVPGVQTDILVAEALGDLVVAGDVVIAFSHSYDAAWKIVEHIRSQGWLVRIQEMPDGVPWLHDDKHEVHKRSVCILYPMCVEGNPPRITAYGETSCMAIIRALLMWRALHQPTEGRSALSTGGTYGSNRSEVQHPGRAGDHEGHAYGEGLRAVSGQG